MEKIAEGFSEFGNRVTHEIIPGITKGIETWYRLNTQQANMLIFIFAVCFFAGLVLGLMTSRIGLPEKKHHFSKNYLPGEKMAFSGDMDALISDHEEHSQQGI